ncbi:MAG TPA: amidohydrolase family protein [Cyclobacteriaceae bacterium]|nr:amidohydrolase family protein [Cyclobacteriaceae bacterium]
MKHLLSLLFIVATISLQAQDQFTLISNTNVIDVATGKVTMLASVLIKNGVVEEVFTDKKMKLPPNTQVIDGTSKFVIPGMTDAHVHFFQSGGLYTRPDVFDFTSLVPFTEERRKTDSYTEDFMRRYLRMGITTVADVGGPMKNFQVREAARKNPVAPTVLATGPLFSMVERKQLDVGDPPIIKTTSIAEADVLMDKLLAQKPDYIKIWYIVTPDLPADKTFPVVQHIAKRTHGAKLKLAVHATQMKTAELAVDAGADILVHSVDDQVVTDQFVKKLADKKVSYIPTLIVYKGYTTARSGKLAHHPLDLNFANPFAYGSLSDPEHMKELPESFKRARAEQSGLKDPRDSIMANNLRKIFAAGINVVAGTDAGNVGTMHASSFIQELIAMKGAGLSNAEILKTATLNSALCFNQNTGAITKGKTADLVVLTENPLGDLSNLTKAEYVLKSGRILKADTLIKESPEMIVQRQVNAFNARNEDAFGDTYHYAARLSDFPNFQRSIGDKPVRESYGQMFKQVPDLHGEIVKRIVMGKTVIDHERVRINGKYVEGITIYQIFEGKIHEVTFMDK